MKTIVLNDKDLNKKFHAVLKKHDNVLTIFQKNLIKNVSVRYKKYSKNEYFIYFHALYQLEHF